MDSTKLFNGKNKKADDQHASGVLVISKMKG
jgi:hypothetical protein